jgi:inner membrane protein
VVPTGAVDNLTHSLAGAAVAELAVQLRAMRKPAEDAPALRGALWLTSMVASNAPDLDILLSPTIRSPLGYMLHHRGHTHTVLLAPVLGALSVGIGWLWARRRGGIPRSAFPLFLVLATAMVLLHVAMDFGNSYGVHPFWPFESRWHYGDSIFIVEPLLLAVLAVPLAFTVKTRLARIALAGIAALGLILSAIVPMVTPLGLALAVIVTALVAIGARNLGSLGRPMLALLGLVVVEASFFAVHVEAEIHARGAIAAAFPRATPLDVVMSPSPANPLCWSALAIEIEGTDLVSRRLAVSLAGEIQHVDGCRFTPPTETTAAHTSIERTSTESVRFFDETRTPLALLRDLAANSEDTAAFLRFSRAPYLLEREGEPTVAGDVRYDRETGLGFGELEVHRSAPLGGWVPSWEPPRIDAIDPTRTPARRVHDIVTE